MTANEGAVARELRDLAEQLIDLDSRDSANMDVVAEVAAFAPGVATPPLISSPPITAGPAPRRLMDGGTT